MTQVILALNEQPALVTSSTPSPHRCLDQGRSFVRSKTAHKARPLHPHRKKSHLWINELLSLPTNTWFTEDKKKKKEEPGSETQPRLMYPASSFSLTRVGKEPGSELEPSTDLALGPCRSQGQWAPGKLPRQGPDGTGLSTYNSSHRGSFHGAFPPEDVRLSP